MTCGKRNCMAAMGFPGYRCEYEPGWKQIHIGDEANFLPCVIPNYKCSSACYCVPSPEACHQCGTNEWSLLRTAPSSSVCH